MDPDTDRLLPQIIHSFGILIRNSLHKQFSSSQELKLNPLDLADCDFVFGPVVKLGGPGQLMRSHLLGMLEPASGGSRARCDIRPVSKTPRSSLVCEWLPKHCAD